MRIIRIVGLVLLLGMEAAHARPGLGGSFGSRGSRTFLPPARTATTPFGAAPLAAQRPAWTRTAPAYGAMGLNRSRFGSGFAGGLLGAGIFGILVGHGMFGGLHGMGGMLGLLLQLGLLFLVVRWLMRLWAGGPATRPAMANVAAFGASPTGRAAAGGQSTRGGAGGNVPLAANDYAAFEGILMEVQRAWTRGDMGALNAVATPEMAAVFGRQMADLGARGLRNATSDVRFEKGDLAESWREGLNLFATVAMRYSMIDVTTDGTGRLVDGSATEHVVAREYWTFQRQAIGSWRLSAIQQA